jgi:hypothetical protein
LRRFSGIPIPAKSRSFPGRVFFCKDPGPPLGLCGWALGYPTEVTNAFHPGKSNSSPSHSPAGRGRICLGQKKINFSQVFAGQAVGIKEVHDDIWLVSFMDYDLGYFDLETRVLEPLENPFGPKVLPMS